MLCESHHFSKGLRCRLQSRCWPAAYWCLKCILIWWWTSNSGTRPSRTKQMTSSTLFVRMLFFVELYCARPMQLRINSVVVVPIMTKSCLQVRRGIYFCVKDIWSLAISLERFLSGFWAWQHALLELTCILLFFTTWSEVPAYWEWLLERSEQELLANKKSVRKHLVGKLRIIKLWKRKK